MEQGKSAQAPAHAHGRKTSNLLDVGAGLALALAGFLLLYVPPVAARTDSASPWSQATNARVRLVAGGAGGAGPDGTRLIGVQIELDEGWHTYWRHPGDAGVPPEFNWDRSRNLARAQVKWPAPKRLVSKYGVSYGYYNEVVFPVIITPAGAGPVQLNLDLTYAICRNICYPLQATLSLTLPPGAQGSSSFFTRLVNKALTRVPKKQAATGTPRILGATPTASDGRVILKVKVELARAGDDAALFVEGPDRYYFRAPGTPARRDGPVATFDVGVEGARAIGEIKGAELTATLVTTSGGVEYRWVVE